MNKTTSPDSPTASPSLRENREQGEGSQNRTSQKTVGPALWASVPALLLLGLGTAMRNTQLPLVAGDDLEGAGKRGSDSLIVSGQSAIVPRSQTMVVPTGASAAPILWQARLLAARGVTGRAPIDGQITRVYVHEGQSVEVGDRVLRIASSRQVMPEESEEAPASLPSNRRAERAQVEAAQVKNALQVKMERAQEQLAAAQERVAQAKARIARTTEIVRKLQAGVSDESSTQSSDEAAGDSANAASADGADSKPAQDSAAQQAATQKRAVALRETQDAERKASRAESRAAAAQKRADAQQEVARGLAQKARDLQAQRTRELRQQKSDEENQPADEPLARSSASDDNSNEVTPKSTPRPVRKVSVSQGAVEAAEARAQSAASLASAASDKAQNMATEAARARAAANKSSERASRLMSQLQIFGEDSTPPKSVVRRRKSESRVRSINRPTDLPSISQAARMVQAATEESAAAQSEARRLKAQVDSYSQQAQETRQNLDASSSALEASQQTSQQRSLDRTLMANLSVVRAPSSGTVLWVAPVADDVSSGEPIIRMGRRGSLQARFVDRSGLWRSLKPDMLLPAQVSDASDSSTRRASMPEPVASSTRLPLAAGEKANTKVAASSTPAGSDAMSAGIAVTARVESVTPPEHAGEPAVVRVAVFSTPSQTQDATAKKAHRMRLRSGMTISCLFQRPVLSSISLPRTAILSGDAAPVLLTSAPSSADVGQSALQSRPDDGAGSALATESNNGAVANVVRGANGAAGSNGANAAVGEKSAKTSAVGTTSANAATNAGWVAVLTPLNAGQDLHRIEWRRVVLGAGQNSARQIVDGLQPGERLSLQPALLWTYSQSYGADAMIRLSRRL